MDTNRMRFFVEVCRAGSISRAAENLHISQQGLSSSIHRLESDLGCDLFYRKNGGIVLSDIGKLILPECMKLLHYMDRIETLCSATPAGKYPISLVLPESMIARLPSPLQILLINGNDEFTVNFSALYSKECCEKVESGEACFGIVYGQPDERRLDSILLDRVKQVIIVNRENPLAKYDSVTIPMLDDIPIAVTHKGTYPYVTLQNLFEKHNARFRVGYECDLPHQTIDIIANNPVLAARALAEEITPRDLEHVKVLELADEDYYMPIYLVYKKGSEFNTHERIFKHLILECY